MAGNNHFLTQVYGFSTQENGAIYAANSGNPSMGKSNSFPSAGVRFEPNDPLTTIGTVTINSIITLLPTGLNNKPFKFYVADTVATLNNAAT